MLSTLKAALKLCAIYCITLFVLTACNPFSGYNFGAAIVGTNQRALLTANYYIIMLALDLRAAFSTYTQE